MSLDVQAMLQPLAGDSPCGEDIEYDPSMMELRQTAKGTEDTQFSEGEEADWRTVEKLGVSLFERSKNLEVAVLLSLAGLNSRGLSGLRDGVALLHGMIDQYWDTLYPMLDPDDDNDPTERVNIISSISPPRGSFEDPLKFRECLLQAPVAVSRQAGTFALRDLMLATGEMTLPEGATGEPPSLSLVTGAFTDTDPETQSATLSALNDIIELMGGMDTLLMEKVGSGRAPNLDSVLRLLKTAKKHLEPLVVSADEASGEDPLGDEGGQDAPAGGGGAPKRQALAGEVNSDQDVLTAIDKIITYYERAQPSSPIPGLLKRTRNLVGRSFVDIINDLAPNAMRDVEVFFGSGTSSDSAEDEY